MIKSNGLCPDQLITEVIASLGGFVLVFHQNIYLYNNRVNGKMS